MKEQLRSFDRTVRWLDVATSDVSTIAAIALGMCLHTIVTGVCAVVVQLLTTIDQRLLIDHLRTCIYNLLKSSNIRPVQK